MGNCIYMRDFTENVFNCLKQALFEASWDSVKNLKQPNKVYSIINFLKFLPNFM